MMALKGSSVYQVKPDKTSQNGGALLHRYEAFLNMGKLKQ